MNKLIKNTILLLSSVLISPVFAANNNTLVNATSTIEKVCSMSMDDISFGEVIMVMIC